jgi:hypothetical protein
MRVGKSQTLTVCGIKTPLADKPLMRCQRKFHKIDTLASERVFQSTNPHDQPTKDIR